MNRRWPQDFDRKGVQHLLKTAGRAREAAPRMDLLSAAFIGRPYQSPILIGSAQSPEVFSARTDRFDCVTYIETVLALSSADAVHHFPQKLRQLRYASGQVEWNRRNHYMTEWIRHNLRNGAIQRVSGLEATNRKTRTLDVVPGLAARRVSFNCIPKKRLLKAADKLKTGDLIFFASTRKHLDVFHCGIVINNGHGLRLRHASRSRGAVVEQSLPEFLNINRMAGVIVVRPAEPLR